MGTPGWRRSPVVGVIAGVVIVIGMVGTLSRYGCRSGRGGGGVGDKQAMYCPRCKEFYEVSRTDLGVGQDADGDEFQLRASRAPCPKCGGTDSVAAYPCPKCEKLIVPPKDYKQLQSFQCPHCGKHPYRR